VLEDVLNELAFSSIRDLYDKRIKVHRDLATALDKGSVKEYVNTALGIADEYGNFSAFEWDLGSQVLEKSSCRTVFNLAERLFECDDPLRIPDIIYSADIPNLKISVGSEMAMMLRPDDFWVTNRRTLYAYFLDENDGNTVSANEVLQMYEADWDMWRDFHAEIGPSLRSLGELGRHVASDRGIAPGSITYLWADAIADGLYTKFAHRDPI